MSVTVDANIIIYASNESDSVHAQARALLEDLAAGPDLLYLFWPVVTAYLRIATAATLLPQPLEFGQAAANITQLLDLSHVRCPGEQKGFWAVFLSTAGKNARSIAVTDAHIAALMRQHGVRTIYTRDRDFRRFDGIEPVDPFVARR